MTKRDRLLCTDTDKAKPYALSQGSTAQIFAICGSFFQHAMDVGFTEVNPFRAVKKKSVYKQRNTLDVVGRALTQLQ
nr:hypothetical protein [Pseudomonas sp. CFII64]